MTKLHDPHIQEFIDNGGKIRKMPTIDKSSDRAKVRKRYQHDPCPPCPHYRNCTEPCERVTKFLNHEDGLESWKKITCIPHLKGKHAKEMPQGVSTCEAILINYFIDRLTPAQIANKHYKSRQYIHRVIKKYSKLIIQNIKKSV
jgi:hypothetical protein